MSYLKECNQRVSIKGVLSDTLSLIFRVPQGSVLGPVLFTMYKKPLGTIARRYVVKYHLYVENCIADIQLWMKGKLFKIK